MTTDLRRGITALSFKGNLTRDSERLHILVSMTIWAIWKSGNKNTLQDQVVKVRSADCPTGRLTHQQAVPESHTWCMSARVHGAFPPLPPTKINK